MEQPVNNNMIIREIFGEEVSLSLQTQYLKTAIEGIKDRPT